MIDPLPEDAQDFIKGYYAYSYRIGSNDEVKPKYNYPKEIKYNSAS